MTTRRVQSFEHTWKTVALYFLPGILFTGVLYLGARPLASSLGWDLWLTQIGLVLVALLGLEGCLAWFLVKPEAGGGWKNRARALGLAELSFREVGIVLVVSALACAFMKYLWSPYLGMPGVAWLSEFQLFDLPDWHYQRSRPPELSSAAMTSW